MSSSTKPSISSYNSIHVKKRDRTSSGGVGGGRNDYIIPDQDQTYQKRYSWWVDQSQLQQGTVGIQPSGNPSPSPSHSLSHFGKLRPRQKVRLYTLRRARLRVWGCLRSRLSEKRLLRVLLLYACNEGRVVIRVEDGSMFHKLLIPKLDCFE